MFGKSNRHSGTKSIADAHVLRETCLKETCREDHAGGIGKQEFPLTINSFHRSYVGKGHFRRFRQLGLRKFFWGQAPRPPTWRSIKTNILTLVRLEESLQTKIYSCEGTYLSIDVPLKEVLPPAFGTRRYSWKHEVEIRQKLRCI